MRVSIRSAAGAILALCALSLGGCAGYHVGPISPKFMEGAKTVAVPVFHNNTVVPRLETLAADCVIKQFQVDGTYQIRSESQADMVVKGTVTQIFRYGARSVQSDVLKQSQYNLMVTVAYTVTKRSTNAQVNAGSVIGATTFFVSGNDVNQDERQAIPLALSDAAVHLVSRISEGW